MWTLCCANWNSCMKVLFEYRLSVKRCFSMSSCACLCSSIRTIALSCLSHLHATTMDSFEKTLLDGANNWWLPPCVGRETTHGGSFLVAPLGPATQVASNGSISHVPSTGTHWLIFFRAWTKMSESFLPWSKLACVKTHMCYASSPCCLSLLPCDLPKKCPQSEDRLQHLQRMAFETVNCAISVYGKWNKSACEIE